MDTLSGVFCAFWTASNPDGEVLWPAMERHLEFVLKSGVANIMALGSTAEFPHFTVDQRKRIVEKIMSAKAAHPGGHVIVNASHVSSRCSVELARHARAAGAAAAALLPPWFFPAEQRDLAEFFIHVGRAAEIPLVLYNFPEVTGKRIDLETVRSVASEVPILAVKQSGGEFEYHKALLDLGRELGFSVLTGSDSRLEECLRLGCSGTVSGLANAVPDVLARIHARFSEGKTSPEDSALMTEIGREMSSISFPLNVRAAIAARGFEPGAIKNPVSSQTLQEYGELVARLSALFADSLPMGRG